MFRQLIVGVFLLIAGTLVAQEGTTSPYSYYGIGTLKFRGTTESRSMGGVGVFSDSIHLNLQNPAAYSGLRLVNFSVGASHQTSTQKTNIYNLPGLFRYGNSYGEIRDGVRPSALHFRRLSFLF